MWNLCRFIFHLRVQQPSCSWLLCILLSVVMTAMSHHQLQLFISDVWLSQIVHPSRTASSYDICIGLTNKFHVLFRFHRVCWSLGMNTRRAGGGLKHCWGLGTPGGGYPTSAGGYELE